MYTIEKGGTKKRPSDISIWCSVRMNFASELRALKCYLGRNKQKPVCDKNKLKSYFRNILNHKMSTIFFCNLIKSMGITFEIFHIIFIITPSSLGQVLALLRLKPIC